MFSVALAGTPQAAGAHFICDGVNDDVEINAAIEAARAAGGGRVQIAAGIYSVTTNLFAAGLNVSIEGAGQDLTVLRAPAHFNNNGGGLIYLSAANGFVVRGLTVDASDVTPVPNGNPVPLGLNGIVAADGASGVIQDCKILIAAAHAYAIWLYQANGVIVRDNRIVGDPMAAEALPWQEGIEVLDSHDVIVDGNQIESIHGNGVFVYSPYWNSGELSRVTVSNNTIDIFLTCYWYFLP